jgi:RNA polymerase sigma factor (sigma-70 family)
MMGDGLYDGSDRVCPPGVTNASDDELLALMRRDDDRPLARAAGTEFYRRHVEFLFGVCRRTYSRSLGEHGVEDLVADTFRRVISKGAATYQRAENGDSEYRLRRVQAWLTTIAERLACDMLGARRRHAVIQIEQEEWQEVPANLDGAVSEKTTAVRHVIDSILSDREQDVILTTFHWHDPEKAHQKLPEHVLSDLARRWNTSQDSIRQIRSRALSKLKPALESVVARASNEG